MGCCSDHVADVHGDEVDVVDDPLIVQIVLFVPDEIERRFIGRNISDNGIRDRPHELPQFQADVIVDVPSIKAHVEGVLVASFTEEPT